MSGNTVSSHEKPNDNGRRKPRLRRIDQTSILYRLRIAIGLLVLVIMIGTGGFMILMKLSFFNALYFTVQTVGAIGYGDFFPQTTAGRIFTTFFILGGLGTASYSLSVLLAAVIEGHLQGELKTRKMLRALDKMRDHIILCGYGRVGNELANSFSEEHVPFVVIDDDEAAITRGESQGHMILRGDATSDDSLKQAGIDRARVIVPALDSDADNLFIVISARQLNPKIMIVARALDENSAAKMQKAGADKIVRPVHIGARHFAQTILRPTVLDFVPVTGRTSRIEYTMEEIAIAADSPIVNKTLADLNLRSQLRVILIGVKRADGDLVFNPSGETKIYAGDTLVAMGDQAHLDQLNTWAGANKPAQD